MYVELIRITLTVNMLLYSRRIIVSLTLSCPCFLFLCASCQVILVSANKLTRYIEPCQLTDDFGGSLDYDHNDWLNKRLVSVLF